MSRPCRTILDEVRRLLDNGYRELVLTGVHLGHYGVEQNRGKPKSDVVAAVASGASDRQDRRRLPPAALQPGSDGSHARTRGDGGGVPGQDLSAFSRLPAERFGSRPAPHAPTLGHRACFVDRCRFVQDRLPLPALTTDVIVGFPGRKRRGFRGHLPVVRDVGFSKIHVFPFSPRQGTPAADPILAGQAGHCRRTDGRRCTAITTGSAEWQETLEAEGIILATGRFLGGGLTAGRNGIRETLFGLPVAQPPARDLWHRDRFLDHRGHPVNEAGLEIDDQFRPLGTDRSFALENLFAAGSVLAHQDWVRTKSGAGLAIATAYGAVESFLRRRLPPGADERG